MASGPTSRAEDPRGQQDPRGNTHAAQAGAGGKQGHALRQPNEHDESADSQSGGTAGATAVGRQAHHDATSGQQDTDRGPVADKVYRDNLRGSKGSR